MFESRISAGATEKLPGRNLTQKTVALSFDMEGHAKNAKTGQLYKVSTPCMEDHNFKKEDLKMDG